MFESGFYNDFTIIWDQLAFGSVWGYQGTDINASWRDHRWHGKKCIVSFALKPHDFYNFRCKSCKKGVETGRSLQFQAADRTRKCGQCQHHRSTTKTGEAASASPGGSFYSCVIYKALTTFKAGSGSGCAARNAPITYRLFSCSMWSPASMYKTWRRLQRRMFRHPGIPSSWNRNSFGKFPRPPFFHSRWT